MLITRDVPPWGNMEDGNQKAPERQFVRNFSHFRPFNQEDQWRGLTWTDGYCVSWR